MISIFRNTDGEIWKNLVWPLQGHLPVGNPKRDSQYCLQSRIRTPDSCDIIQISYRFPYYRFYQIFPYIFKKEEGDFQYGQSWIRKRKLPDNLCLGFIFPHIFYIFSNIFSNIFSSYLQINFQIHLPNHGRGFPILPVWWDVKRKWPISNGQTGLISFRFHCFFGPTGLISFRFEFFNPLHTIHMSVQHINSLACHSNWWMDY